MSKCVIWIGWREFGVIPHVEFCRRKWVRNLSLVVVKTYSSFLNLYSSNSLVISLKVSSSVRKISPCAAALFANARKLMLANFRLKIGPFQSRARTLDPFWDFDAEKAKTDTVLANKRLLAGTIYITFLIYLKAIFGQKINSKKQIFQLLPRNQDFARFFLSTVALN